MWDIHQINDESLVLSVVPIVSEAKYITAITQVVLNATCKAAV